MTCRMLFGDADEQRVHYKTDFHRFNLKRKIAALAPVSMEQFTQKVEGKTDFIQLQKIII
jgi:pre-60S factor REI1